jgi:lipoprotein-releasing system ATP-binding protein
MSKIKLLLAKHVAKIYQDGDTPVSVLKDASLNLHVAEKVAIVGPSGSGKSTLLYILGLLDQPTSGEMSLLGETPQQWSAAWQAAFRNERIGFVFQEHHLLPQCTVLENVLLPVLPQGAVTPELQARAVQLLTRVGLAERLNHRPAQLSGGERQRAAVCRALINQPALVLADEPTGNLDRQTAETVGQLLLELAAEQQVVLICVTHSQALADRFPQRYELQDGQLVAV